jgi:hypothetical protein
MDDFNPYLVYVQPHRPSMYEEKAGNHRSVSPRRCVHIMQRGL